MYHCFRLVGVTSWSSSTTVPSSDMVTCTGSVRVRPASFSTLFVNVADTMTFCRRPKPPSLTKCSSTIFIILMGNVNQMYSNVRIESTVKTATHLATSFSYPISKSRSASSMTSQCNRPRLRFLVELRWSNRRPGVDIKIFIPLRILAFSDFFFSPPIK